MRRPMFYLTLFTLIFNLACKNTRTNSEHSKSNADSIVQLSESKPKVHSLYKEHKTQTIELYGVKVDLKFPDTVKGYIMVLPGWGFPRYDWCNQTSLCQNALKQGFALVMPDMGESIYASQFYPQSWDKMRKTLTRRWVTDTLIKYLQDSFDIINEGQNNFIMGLSTGAHGSGLIVEDNPILFKACALLSGDYDQTKLPQDMVFIATYGRYEQFPQRWQTDNVIAEISNLNIPVFIGHGLQDPLIPISQSKMLEMKLKKEHPAQLIQTNYLDGKHDYKFWELESQPILTFFNNQIGN